MFNIYIGFQDHDNNNLIKSRVIYSSCVKQVSIKVEHATRYQLSHLMIAFIYLFFINNFQIIKKLLI